jgi:hypothetical protein
VRRPTRHIRGVSVGLPITASYHRHIGRDQVISFARFADDLVILIDGIVEVTLRKGPSLTLMVSDNGIVCPSAKQERLGSRLTRLLAQQLRAAVTWEVANPGCRVRVVPAANLIASGRRQPRPPTTATEQRDAPEPARPDAVL